MTHTNRTPPATALEAWVAHLAPDVHALPGYLELLQAAELADTVKGQEGLKALEHLITGDNGRTTASHGPFDPEITGELEHLVRRAKEAMEDSGVLEFEP